MKKWFGMGLCMAVGFSVFATEMSIEIKKSTANDGIVDSLFELESLFVEHQYNYLPISPPSSDVFTQDYGLVVPFRSKNLPKEFIKRLVGEYTEDGIPIFRTTVYEDPITRQTVFLNADGSEIYRLDPAFGYDPLAWQRDWFHLGSSEFLDPWSAWIYDPAHIAANFRLISSELYEEYILAEEQRHLDAIADLTMMAMSLTETVTNLMIEISDNAGLVDLKLKWPAGYTNRIEIFSCENLLSNDWHVISQKLSTLGLSSIDWTDEGSINHATRFFRSGDADTNSDGDAITDARENIILGTNPFLTDSDGDSLADSMEARMQSYEVESVSFNWVDIEVEGNRIEVWDQTSWRGYKDISIGFDFSFYGESRTNAFVSKLGYLKFGDPTIYYSNTSLPNNSTYAVLDMVAVFWGGLNVQPDNGASVYVQTLGSAPNRRLVATWKDIPIWYNAEALVTFQVELRESGEIFARYKDMRNGSGDAATGRNSTAGMQDSTGTDGTLWVYNESNTLTNDLAIRYYYAPAFIKTTDPCNWDTDGDGMDDGFEVARPYLDPNEPDGSDDRDFDGLNNLCEYNLGTDVNKRDTDGDGLSDIEVLYGLDPTNALPSDMMPDSDGDGMTNRYEVLYYLDPFDPADGSEDKDGDGLSNLQEFNYGTYPNNPDSDFDGLLDIEVLYGLDPLLNDPSEMAIDSDGDGMTNGYEVVHSLNPFDPFDATVDADFDGLENLQEYQIGTDPNNQDSDGDGLLDIEVLFGLDPLIADPAEMSPDSDSDGMTNGYEVANFLNPFDASDKNLDYDHDGLDNFWEYANGLSAALWDTDSDTLADGVEVEWGTNPAIADDLESDADTDGLILGEEYTYGTDPFNSDSDNDGTDDGTEIDQGSSPTDPTDNGNAPSTNDLVKIKLTMGDYSTSQSEIYVMNVEGRKVVRLHSKDYGNIETGTFTFCRGHSYTVTVHHVGTNLETPDYDYKAMVEVGETEQQSAAMPFQIYEEDWIPETGATGAPPMQTLAVGDTTLTNGIIIKDPDGILGRHDESTYFYADGKTSTVHVVKISGIPLGESTNLSKWVVGKVYVPTKWGGKLTLSGGNVELFYTNGADLDYDTAIQIINGELDADRVAQGDPCLHTVLKDKHKWYYVKVPAESPSTISASFTQKGEAENTPWNGWYWPVVDEAGPNLYSETGPYTPLKDYDTVYGTTTRVAAEAFSSGYTDSWAGHCWGWVLASIALPQPAATTTNGVSFNEDEMEGLYSELGDGITSSGAVGWKVGSPANRLPAGPPTAASGEVIDAWPDDLHNALQLYIRKGGNPMVANLRADGGGGSSEIWNHAIYKYESVMKQAPGNDEKVIEVTTTITSNIDVPAMPSDSDKRQDTYVYVLEYKEDDGTIDGTSEKQNWKSTSGFAPSCIGWAVPEFFNWNTTEHCGLVKDKVDALY